MGLIKWGKEAYKDFTEGRNEARKEYEARLKKKKAIAEKNKEILATVSDEKRMISALAAPFRSSMFWDWFSIFKYSEEENEEDYHYPIHLHTFGPEVVLTDEELETLKKVIERDFLVFDRQTALSAIQKIIEDGWEKPFNHIENKEDLRLVFLLNQEACEHYALFLTMLTSLLISSVDLGYINEKEVLMTMEELTCYTSYAFKDWQDYSEKLLAGERKSKLNRFLGRKFIEKFIGYLLVKAGSPWQWISLRESNNLSSNFQK